MKEHIDINDFKIRKDEPLLADSAVLTAGYGEGGVGIDPGSDDCMAKEAFSKEPGKSRYFIRTSSAGSRAGSFFDVEAQEPGDKRRRESTGERRYEFRRVSKAAFDYYLHYLKTTNPVYLRLAEREQRP
jgi:hypothetical protein